MLPKKSKSTKCEEYRISSILTHSSQILTKNHSGANREKDWGKHSRRPIGLPKEQRHTRSNFVFAKHCREKF